MNSQKTNLSLNIMNTTNSSSGNSKQQYCSATKLSSGYHSMTEFVYFNNKVKCFFFNFFYLVFIYKHTP